MSGSWESIRRQQEKDDIFLSAYEKENKAASDLNQNEIIIILNASCTKVTWKVFFFTGGPVGE